MNKKIITLFISTILLVGVIFFAQKYHEGATKEKSFLTESGKVEDNKIIETQSTTLEVTNSSLDQKDPVASNAFNSSNTSNTSDNSNTTKNEINTGNSSIANNSKAEKPEKVKLPNGRVKIILPDITVSDKDGKKVKLRSFEGKKMIINVWASWCGPCKAEMPDLAELEKELKDDEMLVMVNSIGMNGETVEVATKYVEDEGLEFKNLFFADDPVELMKFEPQVIPTTLIVDSEGYVINYIQGARNKEYFRKALDEAN